MAADTKYHPLTSYHEAIADISSRFTFNHHPVPDRSGLIRTPQGFGQIFFHRPTNTVGVFFSKIANNLSGQILPDGRRVASPEQMQGCYIFGARRLKGDVDDPLSSRPNIHRVRRNLREDLDVARRELGTRSRKHFTLYNAENLYTNGRHVYEILERKDGDFEVVFRMATRRAGGGFVPFDMNDTSLRGIFSRANKVIEVTKTHEQARQAVARHWKTLSSDLWSQRNIFMTQGKGVLAKKLLSDLVNTGMNDAPLVLLSTALVGGALSVEYGTSLGVVAGLTTGFTAAASHTAIHLPIEVGLKEYFEMRKKSAEAKKKLDIEAYSFDQDASDHFKIQTPENISKVCPHIDLERFNPEDFEFLSLDQFSLRKDREYIQDGSQGPSLPGHILFMGQRGFSSQAHILNRRTELRLFQNGVSRIMHEREDGIIIVFAQYRPEMCNDNRLRLAQCHVDQFGGSIVRLEYDRSKATFSLGLSKGMERVSYQTMMDEIQSHMLLSGQQVGLDDSQERSLYCIYTAFSNPAVPFVRCAQNPVSPKLSAIHLG